MNRSEPLQTCLTPPSILIHLEYEALVRARQQAEEVARRTRIYV
jgi:hypothetical protein